MVNLDPDHVRKVLKKTEAQLPDDDVDFYIERYRELIKFDSGLTDQDLDDPKVQFILGEAIIAAIGCEMVSDDPKSHFVKRRKIGNTEQEWSEQGYKDLPNWCDKYRIRLDQLLNLEKPTHQVAPFRRKWQSSRRGWYHKF
jgi:hypothetical protein